MPNNKVILVTKPTVLACKLIECILGIYKSSKLFINICKISMIEEKKGVFERAWT